MRYYHNNFPHQAQTMNRVLYLPGHRYDEYHEMRRYPNSVHYGMMYHAPQPMHYGMVHHVRPLLRRPHGYMVPTGTRINRGY